MKLCENNVCQTFLYVFVWLESNVRLTVFSVHKKTLMQRYNQTLFQRKSNVQLTLEKRNCVTWGINSANIYPIQKVILVVVPFYFESRNCLNLSKFPEGLNISPTAH